MKQQISKLINKGFIGVAIILILSLGIWKLLSFILPASLLSHSFVFFLLPGTLLALAVEEITLAAIVLFSILVWFIISIITSFVFRKNPPAGRQKVQKVEPKTSEPIQETPPQPEANNTLDKNHSEE